MAELQSELDLCEQYLRFRTGVLKQVDLTEVISHRHHVLTVWATQGVDVCAIWALHPHTCNSQQVFFSPTWWKKTTSWPGVTTVMGGDDSFLTNDVEAQHASVGCPFSVFALKAIPQQFAPWGDVPCQNKSMVITEDCHALWRCKNTIITYNKGSHSRLN